MNHPENDSAYRALFRHASVGIIISDERGIILESNPFMAKIFGYAENELNGMPIESLIPVHFRAQHEQNRRDYGKSPKPRMMGIGMNLCGLKKDGAEFPVEISLASYQHDSFKRIIAFVNDITGRKTAEDGLRKLNFELEAKVSERTQELSQALLELSHINENLQMEISRREEVEREVRNSLEHEKELNELKTRFVSMASHEFRTPLGGILTSAALIDRYKTTEEEPKRAKHIRTIKSAVQTLTGVLNDFLSLDKLDQGKIFCSPCDFSIEDLARNIIDEMRELCDGSRTFNFNFKGISDPVCLDRDMLRNVLINLLTNAVKYSPKDRPIDLNVVSEANNLHIEVIDRGYGIPKEDQKNIFQTFFRANNVLTIQGTGLGLNIVKRYLDLMQGSITFASEENQGTTFSIKLPRRVIL